MFVSWKTALSIRCSIQIPLQAGLHAGYFGFCPQPHLNPAARIVVAEADPSLLDCGSQPYNLAVQFKRLVVALGALPQKALSILDAVNYRGELQRSEIPQCLGLVERQARSVLEFLG